MKINKLIATVISFTILCGSCISVSATTIQTPVDNEVTTSTTEIPVAAYCTFSITYSADNCDLYEVSSDVKNLIEPIERISSIDTDGAKSSVNTYKLLKNKSYIVEYIDTNTLECISREVLTTDEDKQNLVLTSSIIIPSYSYASIKIQDNMSVSFYDVLEDIDNDGKYTYDVDKVITPVSLSESINSDTNISSGVMYYVLKQDSNYIILNNITGIVTPLPDITANTYHYNLNSLKEEPSTDTAGIQLIGTDYSSIKVFNNGKSVSCSTGKGADSTMLNIQKPNIKYDYTLEVGSKFLTISNAQVASNKLSISHNAFIEKHSLAGDITMDNTLNISDLIMSAKYIIGTTELDFIHTQAGDMNNDYQVNTADLISVAKTIVGM